jgi:hypothetical protein
MAALADTGELLKKGCGMESQPLLQAKQVYGKKTQFDLMATDKVAADSRMTAELKGIAGNGFTLRNRGFSHGSV